VVLAAHLVRVKGRVRACACVRAGVRGRVRGRGRGRVRVRVRVVGEAGVTAHRADEEEHLLWSHRYLKPLERPVDLV